MSFVDFVASDENTRIAQVVHLEGRDIRDYDFVFLTESLDDCLDCLTRKFGFLRQDPFSDRAISRINESAARTFADPNAESLYRQYGRVTDEQRREVYRLIPEEVDLYKRAHEHVVRVLHAAP